MLIASLASGAHKGGPPVRSVRTAAVEIVFDADMRKAEKLSNRLTGSRWLSEPGALYRLKADGDVKVLLEAKPLANGQIALRFSVRNTGKSPVSISADMLQIDNPANGCGCIVQYRIPTGRRN